MHNYDIARHDEGSMKIADDRIEFIDSKVADVYDYLPREGGDIALPISINGLYDQYGITLLRVEMRNDVSGAFDRASNTVWINKKDIAQRQRFTASHEFGHYILHHDHPQEILYRNYNTDDELEAEADYFAAKLLMPGHLVKKYWAITKKVEDMAFIFNVSYSAMDVRLKNLKLKPWSYAQ